MSGAELCGHPSPIESVFKGRGPPSTPVLTISVSELAQCPNGSWAHVPCPLLRNLSLNSHQPGTGATEMESLMTLWPGLHSQGVGRALPPQKAGGEHASRLSQLLCCQPALISLACGCIAQSLPPSSCGLLVCGTLGVCLLQADWPWVEGQC